MNNEQAFTNLVRRQRSTIYTVCYMFSSDQDEVNNLFQEVLIRLWQGWEKFRGECDERTWVYRVALNCGISIAGALHRCCNVVTLCKSLFSAFPKSRHPGETITPPGWYDYATRVAQSHHLGGALSK